MQKIYSMLSVRRTNAYVKTIFLSIFSFFLFSSDARAQAGNNLLYTEAESDYLTLPTGIVSTITGSFTIEAWINWKGTNNSFPRIIDFGNDQNNWIVLSAAIPFGSTGPRFIINEGGTFQFVDAATPITPNVWSHIAVTLDASTNTANIYVDGSLSGTTPGFTFRLSDLGSTTSNWLGKSEYPTDPYYDGNIDELRISNTVRYTGASFTVPTTQFASDANTVALFHFNEGAGQTTTDVSSNAFVATLGATTSVETEDPSWATGSILPIKLTAFSANAVNSNKAVDLKWSASVDRESEFVLERSNNGKDFIAIGKVIRATATQGIEEFSYRDNTPFSGRSYYRIKCIETGSAPLYSKIIPLILSGREELILYPNPVKGNVITIESSIPYTGNVEISVSNSSGVVVVRQKINAINQREFRINRGALPSGTYLLEFTANEIKRSKMIVCQ